MQAANDCHSLRTGDTTQQIEHARARIEAGYRFIGNNERWALQQRSLSSSGHYRRSGLLRCGISIRPMSALGHKRTKRVRPNDRVCPLYPQKRTSFRLFRRQLFASAAIEEPHSPLTRGSGQILTQLRLRRALANCSGRFRDANLNPYDHLCKAGRA